MLFFIYSQAATFAVSAKFPNKFVSNKFSASVNFTKRRNCGNEENLE